MKIIGLTGSIAMGKSEVAKIFAAHGIPIFDADKEVHALYDSKEGADLLRPFVPQAIVSDRIDRQKLTAIVMENKSLLEQLEPLVHAKVAERRKDFLNKARKEDARLVVLDIPLLFEKDAAADVDLTIVVSASPDLQRRRAHARPGMTGAKLDMILARQMPDAEKRKRADIIIDNNGTLDDLRRVTEAVIQRLS
jgi:dephospho-CoA kinase